MRIVARLVGETDAIEQLADPSTRLGGGDPEVLERERDVPCGRPPTEQAGDLTGLDAQIEAVENDGALDSVAELLAELIDSNHAGTPADEGGGMRTGQT
jgi:hypothetical protein